MLKELNIENLAVIEKAAISFCDKFNVFSGETGAGKSILIGGINAVLGARTDKSIVRTGENKAVVTALFDDISKETQKKLEENGYSYDGELLLQREISSDGKSTARINGKVTTAAVLKSIASDLIDIHGQHDTAILMSTDNQRQILDSYGGLNEKLSEYREIFHKFSHISKQVKALQQKINDRDSRIEDLKEKIEEVSSYNLYAGEEKEVTEKLEEARNLESVQKALSQAYGSLCGYDDEGSAASLIRSALNNLDKISDSDNENDKYFKLSKRLSEAVIEIEDIGLEISKNISDEYSSENISQLESRLSDLLLLKRRYRTDIDRLISDLEDWKRELEDLQCSDDVLEELNEKRRELAEKVKAQAAEISDLRKKAADELVKKITEELVFLDMPNIRFIFDFQKDKISITGMDKVEMLISVNKGEEPKSMNKIASGGELSRIMLAVKNVLASSDNVPTMIFDEIDTGISGRAAQKVGIKLSEISDKRQVLCVTHLAQIAAMGDRHLLIEKKSDDLRTYTTVHSLGFNERKREIARIISGNSDSEAALLSAEELLNRKKSK
ncbi:MAG TPA: DNA repair protein RecN [Ruminococcaceae bacterium]|nr:DNA repair protein RecN [Oscillospiraceae bacterium]